MTENVAFERDDVYDRRTTTTETPPVVKFSSLDIEESDEEKKPGCCSWNQLCDVFGNRQGNFIMALRPLRQELIVTQQQLKRFTTNLERNRETRTDAIETANAIMKVITELNAMIGSKNLNIPTDENSMLRQLSYDLVILLTIIENLTKTMQQRPKQQAVRSVLHQNLGVIQTDDNGKQKKDMASGDSFADDELISGAQALTTIQDEVQALNLQTSLKERISRNSEMIEKVIKFIDAKTQRRWWLRDVINFAQLFIKLALFISAAISVVYHQEKTAPIITLTITIIQGIVEMLDQYFLKHTKPEDLNISVLSTLSAMEKA